jgi:DNA repair protein RecO (recombination protein O)
MNDRTFSCQGIVLKRTNLGETDRIVSILTQQKGKITCVAKGVRKLKSSKRALLEPGNYVKGFFVATKNLPLLTQAVLLDNCQAMSQSLKKYRELSQFLEILEKLFVEEELDDPLFNQVIKIRSLVVNHHSQPQAIRDQLGDLIMALGFQHPKQSEFDNISQYVSELVERPVRSFEYLAVK